MCECCRRGEQNFFIRKILAPAAIVFNIGLTIFFLVSNAQNYEKYKNRASYVVYHVSNTTSHYYIIRDNLNDTVNCSSNALFTFDVTTVYENIISKQGAHNILFVTVYWLSTIVATLLSLFDIILAMMACCKEEHDDYEHCEGQSSICYKLISSIGSQFLQKGSFLFPTYFIGIFDYAQLCLPHHTKESLFLLHHTYIGIVISLCSMICLLLWTWACWDSQRHDYGTGILWIKYVQILTCDNKTASVIILILLCFAVILIGAYGIFVWITSLMELLLTTKAVLICFNFVFGVFHEVIKFLRHC